MTTVSNRAALRLATLFSLSALAGCIDLGGIGGGGGSGGGAAAHPIVACPSNDVVYACADGIDNDGDGLIDSDDRNCLGPCHNNEAGYTPNISGTDDIGGCARDCYFDGNGGSGDDGCSLSQRCDLTLTTTANDVDPNSCDFSVSAECPTQQGGSCIDGCTALLPNGCDAFGCCDVLGDGDYVFLGSGASELHPTCTVETLDDPTKCYPCEPDLSTVDDCGQCELCLGKTEADLPPHCFDDGGSLQCPGGEQPCGLSGQDPCAAGFYCLTGCCVAVPG